MTIHFVFVQMILQFVGIRKSSIAMFTDVRSSFHVNRHVTFNVTRLREVAVTHRADVWLDFSMRQQMSLQVANLNFSNDKKNNNAL